MGRKKDQKRSIKIKNIEDYFWHVRCSIGGRETNRVATDAKGEKKMEYYVYSAETNEHVATIVGDTDDACELAMENLYGINDYCGTYSPAFGTVDGLIENPNAERILV